MKILLSLFTVLYAALVCAPGDPKTITGKALNDFGTPEPGVMVKCKSSRDIALTDSNGVFRISLTYLPDTLSFSGKYIRPYQVVVTDKSTADADFEVVLLTNKIHRQINAHYFTSESVASADVSSMAMSAPPSAPTASTVVSRSMASSSSSVVSREKVKGNGLKPVTITGSSVPDRKVSIGYASASVSAPILKDKKVLYSADITLEPYETAATAEAKKLTAGEVSDFKKWTMWEDYNGAPFRQHSRHWNLYPTRRYCLQLTNEQNNGIIGQEVYLIHQDTRDTVWHSMTDNTGKAELWASMQRKDSGSYDIAIKGGETIRNARPFAEGINYLRLKVPCNVPNQVDIAVVTDATGSMGDEIEYLKTDLEEIIRSVSNQYNSLDFRFSSVFYRDRGDEYLTRHVDFKADLLKVLNFIRLQQAGGGGDYPEALNSALRVAVDSLSWRSNARTKILFLILDAPPHDDAAAEMFTLMQKAAAKGIRIVPIACSGTDKSTEFLLRTMALATNGTYLFLTDDSGIGNSHIKPTTDSYDVELLNSLLKRTIAQMIYAPECTKQPNLPVPVKPFPTPSQVTIYPNPARDYIVLSTNEYVQTAYVADFTGKILLRVNFSGKQKNYRIDLPGLPSATYLLMYAAPDGSMKKEKFVVVR